jgi:hypothetical protein
MLKRFFPWFFLPKKLSPCCGAKVKYGITFWNDAFAKCSKCGKLLD